MVANHRFEHPKIRTLLHWIFAAAAPVGKQLFLISSYIRNIWYLVETTSYETVQVNSLCILLVMLQSILYAGMDLLSNGVIGI